MTTTYMTLVQATLLQFQGESPTLSLIRTHLLIVYARWEYHAQLAKMSFDEMFDLTAGVYFYFYDV